MAQGMGNGACTILYVCTNRAELSSFMPRQLKGVSGARGFRL
jgi:hypothetical protein